MNEFHSLHKEGGLKSSSMGHVVLCCIIFDPVNKNPKLLLLSNYRYCKFDKCFDLFETFGALVELGLSSMIG